MDDVFVVVEWKDEEKKRGRRREALQIRVTRKGEKKWQNFCT
jgi:hypothetical protein